MISCVCVTIHKRKYYPLYNISAYFRMDDIQTDGNIMENLSEDTKAGFELAFRVFRILCEEGEAARQHYGYKAGELPDWEDAQFEYSPVDVRRMKDAIFLAVSVGLEQEVPDEQEDKDIDIGLMGIQKKTNHE